MRSCLVECSGVAAACAIDKCTGAVYLALFRLQCSRVAAAYAFHKLEEFLHATRSILAKKREDEPATKGSVLEHLNVIPRDNSDVKIHSVRDRRCSSVRRCSGGVGQLSS